MFDFSILIAGVMSILFLCILIAGVMSILFLCMQQSFADSNTGTVTSSAFQFVHLC